MLKFLANLPMTRHPLRLHRRKILMPILKMNLLGSPIPPQKEMVISEWQGFTPNV